MKILLVCLLTIGVVSCASGQADPVGFKPIYLTCNDVDVISDTAVEQIVAHNEFGAKTYGWKRRPGKCPAK